MKKTNKKMSPTESKEIFDTYDTYTEIDDFLSANIDEDYRELRDFLVITANVVKLELIGEAKNKYLFDLEIALALYDFMRSNQEYDFNLRLASDTQYWIYIHTKVVPDLVVERWGLESPSHIYSQNNRIWLSTLWWFVHICWQGDLNKTSQMMKVFSADTILNVVERSGGGYNIELYKEILLQQSEYAKNHKNANEHLRKLMVLNTSYLLTIEPSAFTGGIKGYVKMLTEKIKESSDDE